MISTEPVSTSPPPHLSQQQADDVSTAGDDGAHSRSDNHSKSSPIIAEITQLWRMRRRWHKAEKSLILQGKALCRAWADGDKTAANKLFDQAMKDGATDDPQLLIALEPFIQAIGNFQALRSPIEKRLKKLSEQLPVWEWVSEVKGFGPMNLAALVGECAAPLNAYKSPSAVWKRMGLAVFDGERQRRVTDKDKAILMGYNAERRAVAWNIGECLIKSGDKCRYRPIYDERKAYEAERLDPEKKGFKAHCHNRAARYMTKRVIRDLWRHWRDIENSAVGEGQPASDTPVKGANLDGANPLSEATQPA